MANANINIKVGYSLDKSKWVEVQKALDSLSAEAAKIGNESNVGLQKAAQAAREMSNILNNSFSKDLGTVNITKFSQQLAKSKIDVGSLKTEFTRMGEVGSNAFNTISNSILGTSAQIKNTSAILDRMAVTFKNTVRYGISSSIWNTFANSFQKAYDYSKDLNESLNNIRIVTKASSDQMEQFAVSANEASKRLGTSTLDYTNAALIYYQQGLDDQVAQARAEVTLKAANVTGQSASEVSEMLTAVWNGYKVSAAESEKYIDKLAAVAAHSASNLEELSTGMSKVAAAANTMGVDIDQLNAQIATIISATRQAPESVGVALKTIYARMGDIEAGLDDETTLGNYTEKMAQYGINVLDANKNLRDMGDVIEEIGGKWEDMSREQQVALAQTMAGTRQYNNLLALFDNWDNYTKSIETSKNATGELQKQQDIYMESTEAHLKKLKATWQDLYKSVIVDEEIQGGIDLLTDAVQVLDNFVDSFGGGIKSLAGLGMILSNVFNKQLTQSITNYLMNQDKAAQNIAMLEQKAQAIQQGSAENKVSKPTSVALLAENQTQLKYAKELQTVEGQITQEQYNQAVNLQTQLGELEREATYVETIADEELKQVLGEKEYQFYLKNRVDNMDDINQKLEQEQEAEEKILEIYKMRASAIESSFKWSERREVSEEEILNVEELINSLIIDSTSEAAKELDVLTKNFDINKATSKQKIEILARIKEIVKAQQQEVDAVKKKADAEQKYEDAVEKGLNIRQSGNGLKQEFDDIVNYGNRAASVSEKVIGVTSSLSSLAIAWSSINSLVQTWSDENASFGDKLTQTFMTLGMVIPIVIKTLKDLNVVQGISNAMKATSVALFKDEEILKTASIALSKVENKQLTDEAKTRIIINALKNKGININKKEAESILLVAGVKKADTRATWGLKAATDALTASMAANPFGWFIIAAAAAVGAIAAVTGAINAHTRKVKENNDATIESSNKIQVATEENLELYNSWMKLYDAYKNNTASKDELDKKTDELKESLGDESVNVLKLTGNYEELRKQLIKLREEEITNAKTSADLEKKAAAENMKIAATEGSNFTLGSKYYAQNRSGSAFISEEEAAYFKKNLGNYAQIGTTGLGGIDAIKFEDISENYVKFYDDLIKTTEEMSKAIENGELEAGKGYEWANNWLKEMKDSVEQYKQSTQDVTKYKTQLDMLHLDWSKSEDWETFKANREKIINSLKASYKEEGKTDQEAEEQAQQTANIYLENFDTAVAANVQRFRATEELVKKFGEDSRKLIEDALQGLDIEQIQLVANVDTVKSLENIDEWLKIAQEEAAKYKITTEVKTNLKDAGASIEDEAFETLVENLKQVGIESRESGEALREYNKQTEKVATYIVKANKALEDLNKTFEEDSKIIDTNKIETQDYAEAFTRVKNSMEALIGAEVDNDFVLKHYKDLQDILDGDLDKIKELRKELTLESLNFDTVDWDDDAKTALDNIKTGIDEINSKDIKVNSDLDNTNLINGLNELLSQEKITVDQANDILSKIGYEPKITYQTETVTHTMETQGPNGPLYSEQKASVEVPVISGQYKGTGNKNKKTTKKTGSGGSSGKQKTEKLEGEADRYHDVNVQLELISNEISKIEKQKDKLLGSKLIDALNKKIALLNKQMETTEEKIKIAQGEVDELKNKLADKGVSFAEDGTIANYTEVYNTQLAYTNKIIDKYNKMSAKAQKKYEKTMQKAKEDFEKFVDNIDRYDELITDMIPGLEEDIQEAVDEKIDLEIEKFDMSIDIRLDLKDAEQDWNEFKKYIIDSIEKDDILGNAMAKLVDFNSYYKEDGTGIIQALRAQVDNTLQELNEMDKSGWSKVYGNNRVKALEDLKNYYDKLADNLVEVADLQKEVHESYMDMMDEAQDKFDEQINSYEAISDILDHDMKIISLFYGEESYSKLTTYFNKQQENNKAQLDFQKQQVDFWKNQMDVLDETTDEWAAAKDKYADALKDFNNFIETSIQNVKDKYVNAINEIFQKLNNEITNGQGLDFVEEEWNLINQNAEQYLDNINSMFETQKLESKYLDALDQTDNISAQRQIKALMDSELKVLKEKDKLTQYDIDRANKRYEILLKEIALQEAQQNKNKMRLRRDSQGNYRYEYVADNDEVDKIKSEVDDLYNSLYNFDKAQYKSNLDSLLNTWNEFQEKMADAAQINDPIERAEQERLIREQYGELINGMVAENEVIRNNLYQSAFDDLSRLYDENSEEYQNMMQMEKDEVLKGLIPAWDLGVQTIANNIAGNEGLIPTCKEAFDELNEATNDYINGLQEIEETGQISFEIIGEGLDPTIEKTRELIKNNDVLIDKYNGEIEAIGNVINQLDELCKKYDEAKSKATQATKAAYEYWSEQKDEAAEADTTPYSEPNPTIIAESIPTQVAEPTVAEKNLKWGKVSDVSGNIKSGQSGDKVKALQDALTQLGYNPGKIDGKFGDNTLKAVKNFQKDQGLTKDGIVGKDTKKKFKALGFNTGGYTGSWDNSGKLAILHQKELVLNAQDTKNMLNAISIMRNITTMVGGANMNRLAAAAAGSTSGQLQQNVYIDATFPGVKDAKEIETALNNLVNMASMRATKR